MIFYRIKINNKKKKKEKLILRDSWVNFKKIKLERFAQLKYVIHKFTVLGKKIE